MRRVNQRNVILSSPVILSTGTFKVQEITLAQAKGLVQKLQPENYSCHSTVKVLGVTPEKYRKACSDYDTAIVVKPKKRLQQKKIYSLRELLDIGITCLLIERLCEESPSVHFHTEVVSK